MKDVFAFLIFISFIVFLFGFSYSIGGYANSDGNRIFTEKKCTVCHTINSSHITSKKTDAVDLSDAGALGNSEFFAKYLSKNASIDGKKHKILFNGTAEELETLSVWLAELSTGKK